jgi:hypothetical protein
MAGGIIPPAIVRFAGSRDSAQPQDVEDGWLKT